MVNRIALSVTMILCSLAGGCGSIGPGTVARDRYDYSGSIGESWKRQALLNIVKLRYLDPPIFVDVGQIVAGYSLETGLTAGGTFPETTGLGGNTAAITGTARYTDRPTITYTPMTGNRFIKSLMLPLTPESVFYMVQAGWPADAVFFASVASLNGLKNQQNAVDNANPADPEFLRVLELLRKVQLSHALGMRILQDAKKQQTTLWTFRSENISEQTASDARELRRLLRLDPTTNEFKVVFGGNTSDGKEIAVQTRSILQIMMMLASYVQVPAEHLAQGRALPGIATSSGAMQSIGFSIRSGKSKPSDAFTSVCYRDHWFWIDDSDLKTKRNFSFLMMLFTLADSGEKDPLPLITIPAQ